ncbi:hydrolase [Geobacter sp.]|uniref:hydrolase n=1 Tax=Geobacter sp. TaxID=46610 RepID=UPI00261313BC|nr:hydrolase [Geobacter sp.]
MATQTIHGMLAPMDCAVALIDFQPAMFAGVHSHDRTTIVQNVQVLAKAARLFRIPTILSTVAAQSFSGAMIPEVTGIFPDQKPIDRTSINSWLDRNFKAAIERTGRRKIVVAGLWTEACVMFPALDMLRAGYEVYVPTDACGDITAEAHERAVQRLVQAGAVPMNSLQFLFELQQDWARSETYEGCMEIMKAHTPYGIEIRFVKEFLGGHGG